MTRSITFYEHGDAPPGITEPINKPRREKEKKRKNRTTSQPAGTGLISIQVRKQGQ